MLTLDLRRIERMYQQMENEQMEILHNRFQTLAEAIKYLEAEKFDCVIYPNDWISHDGLINAQLVSDPVICRYSIKYNG